MENQEHKKIYLKISGMRCSSCEVLIERKLKNIMGVERVAVNHASGRAELIYSSPPNIQALNDAVKNDGYVITEETSRMDNRENTASTIIQSRIPKKEYVQIAATFVIIGGIYLLLKQLDILPKSLGVSDNMSYGFVFLLGIVAAMSTCLAVTGGLLLAVAAKHAENHPDATGVQKFKPHIYFNIGRIISYTILGGIVGAAGSFISLSPFLNGLLIITVSIVMILLGLQLLNLFPFLQHLQPKMPKFFAHKVYDKNPDHKTAPFLFGAATFFFPCGFTQALQLYVLSQGSFTLGALTMFFFALGTIPSLISLGAISSFSTGAVKKHVIRFSAVLVIIFGILSIQSGFVLVGATTPLTNTPSIPSQPLLIDTSNQIVRMAVLGLDYSPSQFTIKKGVPVQWEIDGRTAQGCAQIISVPQLGITQRLRRDAPTTIQFTPQEAGTIQFSCAMGMAGPGAFRVVI